MLAVAGLACCGTAPWAMPVLVPVPDAVPATDPDGEGLAAGLAGAEGGAKRPRSRHSREAALPDGSGGGVSVRGWVDCVSGRSVVSIAARGIRVSLRCKRDSRKVPLAAMAARRPGPVPNCAGVGSVLSTRSIPRLISSGRGAVCSNRDMSVNASASGCWRGSASRSACCAGAWVWADGGRGFSITLSTRARPLSTKRSSSLLPGSSDRGLLASSGPSSPGASSSRMNPAAIPEASRGRTAVTTASTDCPNTGAGVSVGAATGTGVRA